jgi:hypothetical protein
MDTHGHVPEDVVAAELTQACDGPASTAAA